jgi:hypothetical protein
MEGTIIDRQIQRFNKRLWLHNLVGIALLIGLGFSQYRYLYNCFLGPQKINTDQLLKLEDADRIDREFVTFTSTKIIDTGINEISINKKTQVETIDAKYAIAILDRGKAILIEVQPEDDLKSLTFTGKLSEITRDSHVKAFDRIIENRPALIGKVSPLMLEKEDYANEADGLLSLLGIGLGICTWNLYKAKARTNNPRKHPIYRSLAKYGDGDLISHNIDDEFNSYYYNRELGGNAFFLIPSWLLVIQTYSLKIIQLDRVAWIFKKVTSNSVNFIPTGKTCELILYDRAGKEQRISLADGEVDRAIYQLYQYAPWAVVGFSPEINKMWNRQRKEFYKMVEQRKYANSQSSSETLHTPPTQENQAQGEVTAPSQENKPQPEKATSPHQESKPQAKVTNPTPEPKFNEKANSPDLVDSETRKRANALANYDKSRIERLLNSVRLNHPNHSEQWYWEKILYDMERDRGF